MTRLPRHAEAVLPVAGLRAVERAALQSVPPQPLMARAGLAAAGLARELAGDSGKPLLVVAGPGNNGGDALVAALQLQQWWFRVEVACPMGSANYRGDAADALKAWQNAGGRIHDGLPAGDDWALVIDGLFGIGLRRDLDGRAAMLVEAINALESPVLSLDVPSGLDADTGCIRGSAVIADHTITFIALKPGLLTADGPDHCGSLHIADLGLGADCAAAAHGVMIGEGVMTHLLPPRPRNSHKGTFGSAGIVGGDRGMTGAALLAGRAALNCGAGRVYAGLLDGNAATVDPLQPELMLRPADGVLRLEHLTALAAGPGLGDSPEAAEYLDWALEKNLPLVLDADALNLIALVPRLKDQLKQRVAPGILTPHPAEAARLLGCTTAEVQNDRLAAALRLSRELGCGVLLKGCSSICAWPDGHWAINSSGNPGMATAGMGDVLTGILAGLLAQGVDERHALTAAAWLHGAAADLCVAEGRGPIGLAAGETIAAARRLLNRR